MGENNRTVLKFYSDDKNIVELNHAARNPLKINEDIYWEIFTMDELRDLAQKSGFNVLNCQRGKIYREEEGTIIHCVCRK